MSKISPGYQDGYVVLVKTARIRLKRDIDQRFCHLSQIFITSRIDNRVITRKNMINSRMWLSSTRNTAIKLFKALALNHFTISALNLLAAWWKCFIQFQREISNDNETSITRLLYYNVIVYRTACNRAANCFGVKRVNKISISRSLRHDNKMKVVSLSVSKFWASLNASWLTRTRLGIVQSHKSTIRRV